MNAAQLGIGFRWRPLLAAAAPDLVRVRAEQGLVVAALANGFDCGFATCWPTGSGLLLDLFEHHWAASAGESATRLEQAFERARQAFCREAPPLIPDDADFPESPPAAVLIAAVVDRQEVHLRWIGGDLALLVHGSEVAAQTRPHTAREKYKKELSEADRIPTDFPNFIVRTIGPGAPDAEPSEHTQLYAEAGDSLVLVSKSNFRGPCVEPREVARIVDESGSPAEAADMIAELGIAPPDTPFAAVAVVQIEGLS